MINRIVGRLIKLSNLNSPKYFFSSDDFKKGGKGGKGKYFTKKDRQKDDLIPFQTTETEQKKETHHKTVKFLKKHELKLKEIQPQPKKQLRFRKKQTYDEAETEKPAPFVKPQNEENEQQLIKKSIFFVKTPQPAPRLPQKTPESSSLPQLNQFLSSQAPPNKFYDKMSEDLEKILTFFQNNNWKELNQIVQDYQQYTPAHQIEKELHSLFIGTNVSAYVTWLKKSGKGYKDFSGATLKKLYSGLVRQYRVEELKQLLTFLKSREFDIGYKSIDAILHDIEKDSPLKGLQQKVNEKIDIVLDILSVQLNYNQKHEATGKVLVYTLDEWFNKLAHLALTRQVSKAKFTSLFEAIFIKHCDYIHLDHIHESGLFLNIIQTYYFGSYATTPKIHSLFKDAIHSEGCYKHLLKLKQKLIQYKTKTGKFAFPNAKKLLSQFQHHFEKESLENTLFFYLLLNFSNEKRDPLALLEKRKILIHASQPQYHIKQLLDDHLFSIDSKFIKSRPLDPNDPTIQTSPVTQEESSDSSESSSVEQEKHKQKHQQKSQKVSKFQKKKHPNQQQDSQSYSEDYFDDTKWSKCYFERDLKEQTPQRLGWIKEKQLSAYYSTIKKQIEQEGNPYRRELLENILRAKLNIHTDKNYQTISFVSVTGDEVLDSLIDRQDQEQDEFDEDEVEEVSEEESSLSIDVEGVQLSSSQGQTKTQIVINLQDIEMSESLSQQLSQDDMEEFQSSENIFEEKFYAFGKDRDIDDYEEQSFSIDDIETYIDKNQANKDKIQYENLLSIKSAIKLKKYELAYGLCEKIYMQPLIMDRTSKNISLVVKSFLLEENSKSRIPNIHQIIEQVDDSVNGLSDEFLRSVYDRCDNFDELIWNYVPPKNFKFQYWRTTLALDRGQELIKMDISNKLKTMQYEPQYDVLPPRERDEFVKKNSGNWREKLMEDLGIVKPLKDEEEGVYIEAAQDDQEFYEKFLDEEIFGEGGFDLEEKQLIEEGLLEARTSLQEGEEVAAEEFAEQTTAEEVTAEQVAEQTAAEEVAEEAAGQAGEESAQAVEQPQQSVEASQSAAVASQQETAESSYREQSEAFDEQTQEPGSEDKQIQQILFGPSNFDTSATVRIKGYDFTSFLDIARNHIKPDLEQQYEQEKQYIKHVINLHSLTEEAKLQNIHYLQTKLFQYQRHVRSISNIATFMSFGLWDYDFVQYAMDPQMARAGARDFRDKFYNFRKYGGKKGYNTDIILNNEKVSDISERVDMIGNLTFSEAMIDDLLIRRMRFFKEAEAVVKLQPVKIVEQLMLWGLQSDEPMGIYLAEKIAMLTNQVISHEVAVQVGNYLSHKRQIPAERVERCKQALKVVGRINRDNIYDFHKEYQHITVRKHFYDYVEKRRAELDSSALQFLSRVDPTHSFQAQTSNLKNNLSRGNLVV